jgi:hypothetical protein
MAITKAQVTALTELAERFVEAVETLAEASVIMTSPSLMVPPGPAREIVPGIVEPAQGGTEDSASGLASLGLDDLGGSPDAPPAVKAKSNSDAPPSLDTTDDKAVETFRTQLGTLIREYGAATTPDDALNLMEEVAGTRRFSEVKTETLEELHDAVYDALAD